MSDKGGSILDEHGRKLEFMNGTVVFIIYYIVYWIYKDGTEMPTSETVR